MKYLILILSLFVVTAHAEEMPAYLKDGVITVTLKNGKTYTYSANEYMVVKRGAKKAVPVVVAQPSEPVRSEPAPREESHKNRISLVVGYGLNGKQKVSSGPNVVDIEQEKGAVGGIVLQRDLNKDYHLMGGALTNQTFMLGIGKGF